MNPESQCEDVLSTMVLENIKSKLLQAFRATGEQQRTVPDCSGVSSTCFGGNFQANEELRRAKIDGAISWIRSELLEMRSQDRQLAQTLLGLNSEIQRLRRASGCSLLAPESPEPGVEPDLDPLGNGPEGPEGPELTVTHRSPCLGTASVIKHREGLEIGD